MPATALHEHLFKIDTHCDTPTASLVKAGWDFAARHGFAADHSQCDLPRMAGSIDAMVFAVYTTQAARTPAGFALARAGAVQAFERTHEVIRRNAVQCG
ncbi:MAG: membrane dipeptidase, partial [Opitutae bacterium]|nr:membrane dipeptidase [Opitutae bacterium]